MTLIAVAIVCGHDEIVDMLMNDDRMSASCLNLKDRVRNTTLF